MLQIDSFDAWQREDDALTERLTVMGDAVTQLHPADIEGAERVAEDLTAMEAREWAELERLADRLAQIPNVEQTEQMARKVGRVRFFKYLFN